MNPLCFALLAACMARPVYLAPAPYLPGPGARPPSTIYVPMPRPPEMAADDPRIAPAPKQYYEPAPDRVWAKVHAKKYLCPGSKEYGQGRGVYLTEADATMSGFHPVSGPACFRTRGQGKIALSR